MIIYGWRHWFKKVGDLLNYSCTYCKEGKLSILTTISYFHISYIPFFPYRRVKATECTHCKAYVSEKSIEDAGLKNALMQHQKASFPIWMFSGFFVIAAIIAFVKYDENRKATNTANYIEKPAVGDIYIVEFNKPVIHEKQRLHYGAYKLNNIENEDLIFAVSEWAFPTLSGVEKTVNSNSKAITEDFEDEELTIQHSHLNNSKEFGGKIIRVIRN